MSRLNLTLDDDTLASLTKHASLAKIAVASFARELLREAVARREADASRRKLARDYAAGRTDATEILKDFETLQLEGLLDDD